MATQQPNRWVRPYVLTAGRTRTKRPLLMETLVSVTNYDPGFATTLLPESRALYEYARRTLSVAELSAHTGLSLGVTRVLLGDLVAQGRVMLHPTSALTGGGPSDFHMHHNVQLLERLRDGLAKLA